MTAYYYHQLNKKEQSVYQGIKIGLQSIAPSFPVPRIEKERLAEIYSMVRMDCPEIFYGVSYKYRFYQDSVNVKMIPVYLFEKNKILDHQKAIKARIEKLVRPVQNLSEKEKLLYIHDFICEQVRYDRLKKPYSHEIIGPLTQGVGVCEGIAKSVKCLCDALNLWCIVAYSKNCPEQGIKYGHMWNVVKIDQHYYHVDMTFDNTLSKAGSLRYDYFCLGDQQIFRDHQPVAFSVPLCTDKDHFYYKDKKLSFTKIEEVRKRSAQAVKKGKVFLFHWRGSYLTREIVKEMAEIFQEEAAKKKKYAAVTINWSQSVLLVRFQENVSKTQVSLEKVNEEDQELSEDPIISI